MPSPVAKLLALGESIPVACFGSVRGLKVERQWFSKDFIPLFLPGDRPNLGDDNKITFFETRELDISGNTF